MFSLNKIFGEEVSEAFATKRRVIFAFYMKELRARFGEYNMGFLWALIEPIAHVAVFSVIFYFRAKDSGAIEYPIFVMLGILPWLLFKNIVRRSVTALSSNRGTFAYSGVRPLDAILGRVFLEFNVFVFVAIALSFIFYLMGYDVFYENFTKFILAILFIVTMSTGLGILCSVLYTYYKSTQKFLNMVFRFLYFLSAIFYPVTIIPNPYREYFLYNPVLQGILLIRNAYDESFNAEYLRPEFMIVFALGSLALGIFYYSLHWKEIVEKQ